VARAYVQGESLKARCGPLYAWSFSRREIRTLNRLKSGKAYQMTNVIPFPSKVVASQATSLPYSCDIIESEKPGFVDVDACVPLDLATKFMGLVANCGEDAACEFTQTELRGLVLIDACVPERIAADFRVIAAAA
jgi:hypothetical protein